MQPSNGARISLTFALAFGLAIAAGAAPVSAQTAPNLSLTVSPLVVEFRAGAGNTGSTTVTVHNGGPDPERLVVQRMDWRVGNEGTVRVEPPGTERDASLTDCLRMEPGDIQLAAGETRTLALTIDLPATFSQASAVYHGGFLLRAVPVTGKAQFGPGATVVVYDTVGTPTTHVKLTQLHLSSPANGVATLVARLSNDGNGYARMSGRLVLRRAGAIAADETTSIPVLFGNETRVFTQTLDDLAPGSYDVSFTVDYGGPTLIEGTTQITVK
jgi:hypothetical protein